MRISIEKNLMVPMRDGVLLATDVYRSDQPGPFPTLLTRLPYNKDGPAAFRLLRRAARGSGRVRGGGPGHPRAVGVRR